MPKNVLNLIKTIYLQIQEVQSPGRIIIKGKKKNPQGML